MIQLYIVVLAEGDWTYLEHTGLFYRYFESPQRWTDALCSCQASAPPGYTGNLASVLDNTTNNFVTNLIGPNVAWLGGFQNSSRADEPWRWSDGSAWDYENWAEGEPNNQLWNNVREDYLEIWGEQKGQWNDCNNECARANSGYVCQYKG